MINAVYGVKDFQTHLPQITREIHATGGHYLVTNRNDPAFVAIPFADYQAIEDILLELNSPILQKEVAEGRREYINGKTKTLTEFEAEND